jgi:hypothetical protein
LRKDRLRFLAGSATGSSIGGLTGVNIAGENINRVRQVAPRTVDELFSPMRPSNVD